MKCYDCGGRFIEKSGALQLHDKRIGDYQVENVRYYKCNECGELLFPAATLRIIEAKESEVLNNLIKKLPIDEFIGATEVANILGKSRQAIHKHRRIKRGFIYSLEFGGRRVYHKKSVELFKNTDDGRFPLRDHIEMPEVKFLITNQSTATDVDPYKEVSGLRELYRWFESDNYFMGQSNAR